MYGVIETNPLTEEQRAVQYSVDHSQPPTQLDDPQLARLTRLRLLTEPGYPFVDVSYAYGVLKDGTPVRVNMPGDGARLPYHWKSFLVQWGKSNNVWVKSLGVFDPSVVSELRG